MKKLSFQNYIIVSSIISLVLTAGALSVVFWNVHNIIGNQERVATAHELGARINKLSGYMVDMESGERGFLISGDPTYLEPYSVAEAEFDKFLNETLPLAKNDKEQSERIEKILKLKSQWIEGPAIGEMMMKRKANAGKVATADFVKFFKASQGKVLTDSVRAAVNETLISESKKLEFLRSENIRLAENIHGGALVVIFTMIFGFGLIVWTTGVVSKVEKNIRSANRTIGAMLHAMKLSVFSIDKDAKVLEPVSGYSNKIFGDNIVGKNIFDCVYRDLHKKSEQYSFVQTALCVVFGESEVQWSLQEDNLPAEIIFKPRQNVNEPSTLRVSYSPIWDDQKNLDKILFVVDDVTDVLKAKKETEEAKIEVAENNQIIQELADLDFKIVEEFLSKIRAVLRKWDIIAQTPAAEPEALMEIFREMHTLKGNARVYRISLIASQIHEVELNLSQLRGRVTEGKVFGAEEISLLSDGINRIRQKAGRYSRIAQKIYKIADEIQNDVTENLHRTAWEEQAALARLRGLILIGPSSPDFAPKIKAAIKTSWRSLVRLRLIVDSLPDKSLFESVEKLGHGLTAVAEAELPTAEIYEINLLKVQQDFFQETSKYLFNDQFNRPMNMTVEAWIPIFSWVFQLSSEMATNCQEILFKAKAHCASHEFDYLECLFANMLERVSVLDLSSVRGGLRHAWNYLSLISVLDIARAFTTEQKLELEKLLSDYLSDKRPNSGFGEEKVPLPSILIGAISHLSQNGVGPKEFFKTFAKAHGDLDLLATIHRFIGDPQASYSLAEIKDCFMKTGSLKDVYGKIRQAQTIVPALRTVVDEALSRDESAMPHYLLIYDIVRVLRTFKSQFSEFEPLSLPKLVQISELSLDKLRESVKDVHRRQPGIEKISRQMDKILEMPVSTIAIRFAPMIQELSVSLKKNVHFHTKGLETTADRQLLYCLQDILLHLFRNSLDHGIESSEERLALGKSLPATLSLEVFRKDSENLVVIVSDDGRGVDPVKVAKKALEKAIVTEIQLKSMAEEEIVQLIFLPGFSTAEAVTQISGIGIGMEVVKTTIENNRGSMKIKNQLGKGLEISIEFPA